MAGASLPGPTCGLSRPTGSVRDGTLMLHAPLPGSAQSGRQAGLTHLQEAIDQLQVAANQFARVAIKEARVRQAYLREIGEMSRKLLREVEQGVISPKQGAEVRSSCAMKSWPRRACAARLWGARGQSNSSGTARRWMRCWTTMRESISSKPSPSCPASPSATRCSWRS